jgi:glutaconyl-CoA/methylmalonyl-CoA decarboxylase subunit gamma
MARETVETPMPGKILSVKVKVGDMVKEDDELAILEAMKMENPIVAPVAGKIVEMNVSANAMVESGQTIAVIEH